MVRLFAPALGKIAVGKGVSRGRVRRGGEGRKKEKDREKIGSEQETRFGGRGCTPPRVFWGCISKERGCGRECAHVCENKGDE